MKQQNVLQKRVTNFVSIALKYHQSAEKAGLTKNQRPGFPALEKNGGVFKGNKGAEGGYTNGTEIPPTKVVIRRPPAK